MNNKEDMEKLINTQEANHLKMVEVRRREEDRKARTHRMVVIGSTLAKYMPELKGMNDDEIRAYVSDKAKDL